MSYNFFCIVYIEQIMSNLTSFAQARSLLWFKLTLNLILKCVTASFSSSVSDGLYHSTLVVGCSCEYTVLTLACVCTLCQTPMVYIARFQALSVLLSNHVNITAFLLHFNHITIYLYKIFIPFHMYSLEYLWIM